MKKKQLVKEMEKSVGKMKKFLSEFKEFAIKGNMIDLAVGVIIGGAFSAIINSIVTHIATPLIGVLIGVDFKEWKITLPRLYGNAAPSVLEIGLFINTILSFIVIALTMFLFIKAINKFRKKQEAAPPPSPTETEKLLTEIRDILKRDAGKAGDE
jgi:large conductance mechanosensitive channel